MKYLRRVWERGLEWSADQTKEWPPRRRLLLLLPVTLTLSRLIQSRSPKGGRRKGLAHSRNLQTPLWTCEVTQNDPSLALVDSGKMCGSSFSVHLWYSRLRLLLFLHKTCTYHVFGAEQCRENVILFGAGQCCLLHEVVFPISNP